MRREGANRRVVLINPRSMFVHEIAQKVFPPINLLYLAAALEAQGFEPTVLEANAFRMTDEEVEGEVRKLRPLVVGLPLYTDILRQVRDMSRRIKLASPGSRLVLGGPHASSCPRRTMGQFPDVDFILRGEAEASLPALCRAISGAENELDSIPGIFYRAPGDGSLVEGAPMELPDPDGLLLPARALVERAYQEKRYYSLMVRQRPVDALISSRGCPFSCGFCYNFRQRYRGRSPELVMDELVRIRGRGIRDVEICDDTFTVDRQRALKIFDLIIKERLDLSFRIKSRVDVFTEELASRAAQAGVYMVSFGMESGSLRMLKVMNKRTTPEMNARAAELCRRHHMLCHSSWLIGYPGETRESVQETVDQVLKIKPSTVNLGVLRPYPETDAYRIAQESGDLVGDWGPDETELPWVRLPWAQDRKVLDDLARRVMRKVYFSPHYIGSFAYQIFKGANVTLGRYAVQESIKQVKARLGF